MVVARVEEVPRGSVRLVRAGARLYALARDEDAFFALANACPHNGGPLGRGRLEDGCIVCPWHGWRWDVRSGHCVWPGTAWRAARVPVRVQAGLVLLADL